MSYGRRFVINRKNFSPEKHQARQREILEERTAFFKALDAGLINTEPMVERGKRTAEVIRRVAEEINSLPD